MMGKMLVRDAHWGTQEAWDRSKDKFPNAQLVTPSKLYIGEGTMCIVIPKEWEDWLCGLRDKMPAPTNKHDWWRQCVNCVNYGKVTGVCSHCNRCPFSTGRGHDLFESVVCRK